jgi:hypothetical protein
MIQIEIRTPTIDAANEHVAWKTIAALRVDDQKYELDDPNAVIDLKLSVPNLRTGGSLHFNDDREEWTRGIPAVYRGPELLAVVVEDDHPFEQLGPDVERESISVPETAGDAAVR